MAIIYAGKGKVSDYNPYISLEVKQSSQSIDGNYSIVSYALKVHRPSSISSSAAKDYSFTINGTKYSGTYTIGGSGTKTIKSGTQKVTHTADGSKTISFSISTEIGITFSGTAIGTVTASGSLKLTTIPRATQITIGLTGSNVYMGDSITMSMARASSSFTHDLAYSFEGGSYVSIATGVGTSRTWATPDLASKVPNKTSGTLKVRCITKNGSTTIGTTYASITLYVPTSVIPVVGDVTFTEATSGLAAQFGAFIQGKSAIKVNITGTGTKGSTIKEYQAVLNGNKTYTGASWTSDVLTTSGTVEVKARVKDSRGRWSAYETVRATVLAYSKPKVQAFSVYRCDADGTANPEGLYMAVRYKYSVTSLGNKNTASMAVKYKQSGASEYTDLLTNTALSADTTVVPMTKTFSVDSEFDVQLTLTDWFGGTPVTSNATLPTAAVIMDIKANGKGIAFGKVSEFDGIDFGWDIVDQIKSFGSMSGAYKTHDGLLLQWGTVTVTPEAVSTPTTVVVTFPRAYASTPAVFLTPVTSVPHNVDFGLQRAADIVGDPAKAVGVTLTRNGLTSTGAYWLAIGREAA